MKKIVMGILILGAFSACASSPEKKVDIPTQVENLNQTVAAQTEEIIQLKAETEELKGQLEQLEEETGE